MQTLQAPGREERIGGRGAFLVEKKEFHEGEAGEKKRIAGFVYGDKGKERPLFTRTFDDGQGKKKSFGPRQKTKKDRHFSGPKKGAFPTVPQKLRTWEKSR